MKRVFKLTLCAVIVFIAMAMSKKLMLLKESWLMLNMLKIKMEQ